MKIRTLIHDSVTVPALIKFNVTECNGVSHNNLDYTQAQTVFSPYQTGEAIESASGRGKVNPVKHRKRVLKVNPPGGPLTTALLGPYVGVGQFTGAGAVEFKHYGMYSCLKDIDGWDVTFQNGIHPTGWYVGAQPKSDNVLIEDCHEKARALKADVLLNIVEANQIWPSIKSLATCLPEMAKSWVTLRHLIRKSSGAYLAWKFGVSPILQDFSNIWKYLPSLVGELKRHEEQQKMRYSALTIRPTSFTLTPYVRHAYSGRTLQLASYRGKALKAPTVRFVLVVKPRVKYMTELASTADFLMKRFATGPATLAWELKPFSFVWDWFVDMRGLLRRLDESLATPPYTVLGFSRSYSYQLETAVDLQRFSPCVSNQLISSDACGSLTHSHYERSAVPPGYSNPEWKPRFGKNQAGISAALISQMLSATNRSRGALTQLGRGRN